MSKIFGKFFDFSLAFLSQSDRDLFHYTKINEVSQFIHLIFIYLLKAILNY